MEAILQKELILNKTICRALGVMAFVVFTVLGAFVRIPLPFTPVPLTLQTFFVLLSAMFLGSRLGAVSQLSYISLGIAGLPVFSAAGSGLLYLFGPTGGYLFGFVLATFLLGKLMKSYCRFWPVFLAAFFSSMLILAFGILWMHLLFGYSWGRLFYLGFLPFIPGDLLKSLAAAGIFMRLQNRIKEVF